MGVFLINMKLSLLAISAVSANRFFETRNEDNCQKTCQLNRDCQYWTFDRRYKPIYDDEDPPNEQWVRARDCFHQDISAANHWNSNAYDRYAGAFYGEKVERAEFYHRGDLHPYRMQTDSAVKCKNLFDLCSNCEEWQWVGIKEHEIPGKGPEHVPGYCKLTVGAFIHPKDDE